jgi:N-acetylglucosaminyldiphosphoundecaprenol N-acetyl-beta-D-mannosaminyltransferase
VVRGVELTKELLEMSKVKNWKIFLLGGKDRETEKLARNKKGNIYYYEPPMGLDIDNKQETEKILNKISLCQPDILLVGLGRFRQEIWIADNLRKIKAKVVIGVGSSFDELAGMGSWADRAPEWVDRMGLKWLWRVTRDPGHFRRAWNAFPVFAWKVFRSPK